MLPGIGFQELILIALAAIIVVGPKDLPMMMRRLGQFVAKGRALAGEFRAAFDDIARQAELDELRKEIEDLKNDNAVKDASDELRNFERDMNDSVMQAEAEHAEAMKAVEPAKPPVAPEPSE